MTERNNPEIQNKRGLSRQRQTIIIKKLNTIINIISNSSILQIQRITGIDKTATNKWYTLVEKKIKTDKLAKFLNPKENLANLLNLVKNRGICFR